MTQLDFMALNQGQTPETVGPNYSQMIMTAKTAWAALNERLTEMVEAEKALEVSSPEANATAVEMANQANKFKKAVDTQMRAIIQEPDQYVKDVRSLAKSITAPFDGIIARLKSKMLAYQSFKRMEEQRLAAEARREAAELQSKLDAQAKAANVEPVKVEAPVIPKPSTVTRTEDGSASVAKSWTYEVTNIDELPEQYVLRTPDKSKLKTAVENGIRSIPGTRIFERESVRLRG